MVAQISSETFNRVSLTPPMDDSDSDDLVLALETARALEAQGDIAEAVRWLRRAADQAEKDGNDARVLVLARAAADLTSTIAPAPRTPAPQAPARPPSAPAPVSQRVSSPPPVPARIPSPRPAPASIPAPRAMPSVTTSPRPPAAPSSRAATSSAPVTTPRVSSRTATPPASARVVTEASHGEAKPVTENTVRVATMRVAIPASSRDANVFVVRRLKAGQPLPAGTTEATLVLTAESQFEQ